MLYRWMSTKEFAKYTAGVTITPIRTRRKFRTNGEGIFFLPEDYLETERDCDPSLDGIKFPPEFSQRFLSGIIEKDSVLVEFDESDSSLEFYNGCGVYASPFDSDWGSIICVDEVTTKSYSRDTLRATRYFFGDWYTI